MIEDDHERNAQRPITNVEWLTPHKIRHRDLVMCLRGTEKSHLLTNLFHVHEGLGQGIGRLFGGLLHGGRRFIAPKARACRGYRHLGRVHLRMHRPARPFKQLTEPTHWGSTRVPVCNRFGGRFCRCSGLSIRVTAALQGPQEVLIRALLVLLSSLVRFRRRRFVANAT